MVSVLAPSVVGRGFEPRSGQTKAYKIGMCCFSTKEKVHRLVGSWIVVSVSWHYEN
jgi:hypothetical protein